MYPKPIELSKETIPRVQAMPGAEGPYRPVKQFNDLSDPLKAITIAAFQIAELDFYTD